MDISLSSKSRAILEYIARGHSYQQILDAYPGLTYIDIFRSAQEVLDILDNSVKDDKDKKQNYNLEKIRSDHPRAYEKWDSVEDEKLVALHNSGVSLEQIAEALQRQRGAIQSRLRKKGLIE